VPLLKTNCNSRRGDFIMGITTYNCEDNAMGMLTYERRTCVRVTSYEKIKKKKPSKRVDLCDCRCQQQHVAAVAAVAALKLKHFETNCYRLI